MIEKAFNVLKKLTCNGVCLQNGDEPPPEPEYEEESAPPEEE